MSDWVEDVTGCVGPPECPECDRLRAALARAEAELAAIDAVLARRPALADCTTRSDMVSLACHTAGKADSERARAERYMTAMRELVESVTAPPRTGTVHELWARRDRQTEAIEAIRRIVEEEGK